MDIHRGFTLLSHKMTTLVVAFGLVIAYAAVVQAAPQYALNCSSCHQMPPLDSANAKKNPANGAIPGNHQKHAAATVSSCAKCHTNGVLAYDNSHRNKNIELSDALGYGRKPVGVFMNTTSVPPNPLQTCTTASCHSNGKGVNRPTPAWGSLAPATCDTCHDSAPSTSSHTKHISNTTGYSFACATCHTNHVTFQHATSAGRNIDVHFAVAPNVGGTFAANQCSNLYCHSNGQTGGAKVTTTPVWGGAATCTDCHGGATSATLSGKHASHVNNAAILGSNYGCVECHSATVSDNSTISDKTKHVNSTIDTAGAHVGTVVAGTCATSYCHSDGKTNAKSVNWTASTTLDCKGCHGSAAAPAFTSIAGEPNYSNAGADQTFANSHNKHVASAADCQNCHGSTTTNGTAIKANSTRHTDSFINMSASNGKSFTIAAKTCSNISCHSGNGIVAAVPAAKWGATLTCAGCHNVPTSSVGGSHTAHLAKAGISCEDCHNATASGNAIRAGVLHVDGAVTVGGGTGIVTAFNATKNCTTVCHNGTSPAWGNPGGVTVCGTCHSVGPNFATNFSQYYADDQALHNVHFGGTYGPNITIGATANGCASCHAFTDMLAANHDNQVINLDGTKVTVNVGSLTLTAPNTGLTAQCSTCHTQATVWKSSASVGGSRLACETCHTTTSGALSVIGGITAPDKTSAATLGHGKAGIAQACTACHDSNSAHISGTLGDSNRLNAGQDCNTCHSNTAIVTTTSKQNMRVHQVSGLGSTCIDCHNPHGTTNNMMVNTTINGTTISYTGTSTFANPGQTGVCQTCHSTTQYFTKAGTTPSGGAHVASTTNCTTCHLHNPTDGSRAFTAPGNCDACHGYPPAPRNVAGLAFGTQGQWSSARFEDYSGGGGAHIVGAHIPASAKASDSWTYCTPCHKGGAANHAKVLPIRDHVENVTVSVDPQLRFSNDTFAIYTTAKLVSAGANKSGSCFNVSCHFATTLKWSTER